MFPITTKAGGMCQAMPDVCNTPAPPAGPIPMPYPNISMCNQALPATCTLTVKIECMPALTKASEIPLSTGDEAGSAGGVMSGKIKGETMFKTFSLKVKLEGQSVVYQTCMTAQNGKSANAYGGIQMDPSQMKVIVMG